MDIEKIVHALLEAPGSLCQECLAQRVGLSAADLDASLERLRGQLKLAAAHLRCLGCSQVRETFRVA